MAKSSRQSDLGPLQQRLGYQFHNPQLLLQALTHKSYAKENNERLEFVGDAVLGYLVGSMLYRKYPQVQEDALSLMRAELVRGQTLAILARELDLAPLLRLGSGELKSGGRQRDSILANAVEAVIGATHEDGGIQPCVGLVDMLYAERIENLDAGSLKDAKTQLQELLQVDSGEAPTYEVVDSTGPDHDREFEAVVMHLGQALGQGRGSSKKAAETDAALDALAKLQES